ncbi:S-layer homology domain-containing protein [Paenibacillus sp. FSL R7-0652]|uniref:S-layer homology domain-containing protein n=1 Tax=Paenibacillus sp. FSL R7-0652 TaxID=2921687 RepID=UPI00315A05E0
MKDSTEAAFGCRALQRLTKMFIAMIMMLALPFAAWGAQVARADAGIRVLSPYLLSPHSAKITLKSDYKATVYYDLQASILPDISDPEGSKANALANHTYFEIEPGEEKTIVLNNLNPGSEYSLITLEEGEDSLLQLIEAVGFVTLITPDQVNAKLIDGRVKLSWTTEDNRTYTVYKYEGAAAPTNPGDWIDITSTLSAENEVPDLVDGRTYIFAVTSTYHSEMEHAVSDYVVSNAVTPGLPEAPATLTPQAANGKVQLNWTGVPEADGYIVYMYQGSDAPQDPASWTQIAGPVNVLHYTVSNLTSGLPYVFAVRSSKHAILSEFKVSTSVTPQAPSSGGGEVIVTPTPTPSPSTSSTAASTAPQKESIKVDVENGEQASTIDSLEISRTRETDGTVKDELGLFPGKAQSIIDQLKKTGSRTAVVLIPDGRDEVSRWDVKLAQQSARLFTEHGIDLVISNPNVKITIPAASLKDRSDDVYFRLVPVKKQETRQEIEQRLRANDTIAQLAGTKNMQLLGRPMTIETNLQSRPVTLVLPVDSKQLAGVNPADLGVYIEHSSGTKELVHGKLVAVNKDNGQQGIEISVDQFSTFSVVQVKDWKDHTSDAKPYIRGYADGRFQPERFVTRAEMTALITRVLDASSVESETAFTDVKAGHWAYDNISAAANAGYVRGYTDGSFRPEQAMTRAEIASVLQHLLKDEQASGSEAAAAFTDVGQHWARKAIARLNAAGVLTGYTDGTFRPEQQVTRAEAVTLINKLMDLQPASTSSKLWSDVPDTHWAYEAVQAASIKE